MVVQNPLFNQAFELLENLNYKSVKTTPDSIIIKMDANKKILE